MEVIVLDHVNIFKESLELKTRARIEQYLATLKEFGYALRMPYRKNIDPGIFELRIMNPQNIRLIYTFKNNCAVVFYGFIKNTEKISTKEMNTIKLKFNNLQL
jgi:phage-related protein